ncbi:unnamed protein product [Diamesa serratosioi]
MWNKNRRFMYTNIPKFQDCDELICSVPPFTKKYILNSLVEFGIQNCSEVAEHYVTTDNPRVCHVGVNHVEGGWPKDINRLDEEQTSRYRNKQEKDVAYTVQMKGLIKSCEHAIIQNNAINLYETYFQDLKSADFKEEYSSKTLNLYRDHSKRGIKRIVWAPNDSNHFASAHCGSQTYGHYEIGESNSSFLWDIEYPKTPLLCMNAHAQSPCLEFNPKNPNCIVTGLITGQTTAFDIRSCNGYPVMLSKRENSHHDRVNAVTFYCSRTNMEFFSGSAAGEIFWWDLRNLQHPTEKLFLYQNPLMNGVGFKGLKKAFGVNVLEYESTIPYKYMVGVDNGNVLICNKKFKTPADRIYAKVMCHHGTVNAVQRNPSFLKYYLSVGDWQAKIWCEELKDSPIIWTKEYTSEILHGCWNTVRCSSFYLSRMDGFLDAWDIIQCSDRPVLSTKLCDFPLLCVSPSHKDGKFIAAGNSNGDIYLVKVSDNLATTDNNDRPTMGALLDRETRREKLLVNKFKELKLKEKENERERMRIKLGLANPEEIEINLANELSQEAEINFYQQVEALRG